MYQLSCFYLGETQEEVFWLTETKVMGLDQLRKVAVAEKTTKKGAITSLLSKKQKGTDLKLGEDLEMVVRRWWKKLGLSEFVAEDQFRQLITQIY